MLPRASRIARDVSSRRLSARDALSKAWAQIDARNGRLLALRSADHERARAAAAAVDARIAKGETLPLAGVPVVIKDNIAQAGRVNDAGRKDGCDDPSARDAVLLARLTQAGAVIVGRANMDELAYGVTGTNVHTGQVRNPWNDAKHPGGSSAGSAVAVAAGMACLAVGTDTAGSVRIPAALCGVVGLRPTPGLVPRDGVAPLASSFDEPGPLAANVADASLMLAVMAQRPELTTAATDTTISLASVRILALGGCFATAPTTAVLDATSRAVDVLARLGITVRDRSIPELAEAPRASGPVIGAEAAFAWKRQLEQYPAGFGETVAGLLRKGAAIPALRYLQARADCERVARAVLAAFDDADLLVLPTTATTASDADDPGTQLVFLALTVPFSIAGVPAISVPAGFVDGLPVGVQIVARPGGDALLLRVAHALEQATEGDRGTESDTT